MINSKRVLKLKKEVYKKVGNPIYSKFVVKTKEGLFLFDNNIKGIHHESKYKSIKEPIKGLIIEDLSDYCIDDILIVTDGKSEPVIILDGPYAERIADGYANDPERPFKDFTTDELKEIADIDD